VLFLIGLPPGDAWLVPAFDALWKNGAPGGRFCLVVMGFRCPSPSQGW